VIGGIHSNAHSSIRILTFLIKLASMNQEFKNGGHQYPNSLTYKTFPNLVLEEASLWKDKDIGNGIMLKQMGWTAGPVRDFQLAGPTAIVYLLQKQCGDERKAVELAIYAVYNPRFSRFFKMGMKHLECLTGASSPSLEMFHMA
jgi:hypothetical protein